MAAKSPGIAAGCHGKKCDLVANAIQEPAISEGASHRTGIIERRRGANKCFTKTLAVEFQGNERKQGASRKTEEWSRKE